MKFEMNPVCVPCEVEMEGLTYGARVRTHDDDRQPVAIWSGEEFTCPVCEREIIIDFGRIPVAEPHHEHFAADGEHALDVFPASVPESITHPPLLVTHWIAE